jgi:hypothetical protein
MLFKSRYLRGLALVIVGGELGYWLYLHTVATNSFKLTHKIFQNHHLENSFDGIPIKRHLDLPKFKVYMYASSAGSDDRFCRSLESAIESDVEVHLLGWGMPWIGLSQKLTAVYNVSIATPAEDVIMFTDAYDVMFASRADALLESFLALNASLVFGAECGCWPHIVESNETCFTGYPPSPTPARYLNSGTWVGYAGAAREMLAAVMVGAGEDFDNANDQKLIADLFLAGRFGIKLDYYSTIFQSMHLNYDPPLAVCDPSRDLDFVNKTAWMNVKTRVRPGIFHFNGNE